MSDNPTPVKRARELRRNMTGAESLLWANLRNRKLLNLKFLRQHPIIYQVIQNEPKYYIADFYCAEKSLIIEVDGKIHDFQKEDDQHREDILKSMDLIILRVKNEEVQDIPKVLEKIKAFINNLTHPPAHLAVCFPLSSRREGLPEPVEGGTPRLRGRGESADFGVSRKTKNEENKK